MINQEWKTGTPEMDGHYIVALFNTENHIHFYSTVRVYLGEWPIDAVYIVTGWMPLPELPEAPKDLPQVEKITWYPFSIKPKKEGVYFIKWQHDGVMIYDTIKYDGIEWPENESAYWSEYMNQHG